MKVGTMIGVTSEQDHMQKLVWNSQWNGYPFIKWTQDVFSHIVQLPKNDGVVMT